MIQLPDNATNAVTQAQLTGTAVYAATMPWWLHAVSDWAQVILPVLGVLVLVVQAVTWLYKTFIRKRLTK